MAKKNPSSSLGNKIRQMDPDFFACIFDLLETPEVLALEDCMHHLKTTRLEHCLNVAYRSYRVAKIAGFDYRSTARGALLHDFYDYTGAPRSKKEKLLHLVNHPKLALENATARFALNDIEQDIIVKHMWLVTLSPPKYKESLIVTFMDKYCAVLELMGFVPSEEEITRTAVALLALQTRTTA